MLRRPRRLSIRPRRCSARSNLGVSCISCCLVDVALDIASEIIQESAFFGRLATALQRGRRCSVEGLPKVPSNMHDSEIGPRLSDYISIPRNS